jgi:hypothetical protein
LVRSAFRTDFGFVLVMDDLLATAGAAVTAAAGAGVGVAEAPGAELFSEDEGFVVAGTVAFLAITAVDGFTSPLAAAAPVARDFVSGAVVIAAATGGFGAVASTAGVTTALGLVVDAAVSVSFRCDCGL